MTFDVVGTPVIVDQDALDIRDFVDDGGGRNALFFLLAVGEGVFQPPD